MIEERENLLQAHPRRCGGRLDAVGAGLWPSATLPTTPRAPPGQIGEQIDGYLGVVGGGSATLRALVDDINIKRRAAYSEKAAAANATLKDYALHLGLPADRADQAGRDVSGP